MKLPTLRDIGTEARLLLIGIPVFLWTMIPIYHMFLFAISPKEDAFSGKLWPTHPTLNNFRIVFHQEHYFLRDFWIQFWNSIVIAVAAGALTLIIATAAAFAISRLKVRPLPVQRALPPSLAGSSQTVFRFQSTSVMRQLFPASKINRSGFSPVSIVGSMYPTSTLPKRPRSS